MTAMTIGSLTPAQQSLDAAAMAAPTKAELAGAQKNAAPTAEQAKAARDFEAIFIRQLLSSLEKGGGLSGGESSGGAVFRSLMVGALADTAAEGGGIGMSELILKAMLPEAPLGKPDLSPRDPSSEVGVLPSAGAPSGSDRLGVTSRVLTEARSVTISSEHDATATALRQSARDVR